MHFGDTLDDEFVYPSGKTRWSTKPFLTHHKRMLRAAEAIKNRRKFIDECLTNTDS